MSNDNPNWKDRVKSPSKTNEKMIGGENNLPKKEENKIDNKKIIKEGEDRKIKPQEFDKKLNAEKTKESFAEQEKRAAKDYDNRTTKATPETKAPSAKASLGKTILRRAGWIGGLYTAYEAGMEFYEGMEKPEPNEQEIQKLETNKIEPPSQFGETASPEQNEKEKLMATIKDFEEEKPEFLNNIEPDIEPEINYPDLGIISLDGNDGSDGSDGGDGGDGD